MKLVINKCFGGFSLSPLAVSRIAELQGRKCHFFELPVGLNAEYAPELTLEQATSAHIWCAFDIPNPNEVLRSTAQWHGMSQEERIRVNKIYEQHEIADRQIRRDDPSLVTVVEELGPKANGRHAELAVVDIPDGTNWEISEYDGVEHIAEKHKTWG